MECNKEEALLAKTMAEKKLRERDAIGAKRLALKALDWYPELDGLSQFLATLEVYISSEEKINGEMNWYSVLGIPPTADDDTIHRHYRKLALSLHPDKNKSVGAEGAFKLVSEAWGCLSDKASRSAFDRRFNACHMYNNVQTNESAFVTGRNGFHDFFKNEKSNLKRETHSQSAQPRSFSKSDTFWTLCAFCKTQFEYVRCYLNSNLICQNCRNPFFAVEMPLAPVNENGKVLGGALKSDTRKESIERKIHGSASFDSLKKKRRVDEHRMCNPPPQMPFRNEGDSNPGGQFGNFGKINPLRELSQVEVRDMLVAKAKKDIQSKLNSFTSEIDEKGKQKQKFFPNCKQNGENFPNLDTKSESFLAKLDDSLGTKGPDPVSMAVPDPDFHDFDSDRTEGSFAPNQVWAAYDDDDGMPRYYAMIHSVISSKPFRMRISWLNSKNNRELSPINWIGSGFFKTSGIFWIGKHEVNKSLNSFSHKVKWAKGMRGTIQIYPSKGDVWAMYSNWSPDWNALTPNEIIHKYHMVEVLEDYSEARGVSVVPLVKVAGFKTVFRHHPDSSTIREIPKEELFRLSHMVPSFVARNVPIGCVELDPASMPLELLQVFTETQVREMVENAKKVEKKCEMAKGKDKVESEGAKLIVYKRKRWRN